MIRASSNSVLGPGVEEGKGPEQRVVQSTESGGFTAHPLLRGQKNQNLSAAQNMRPKKFLVGITKET